eukprot:11158251-Lingulodinium_polyedra.AAC.1
MRAVRRQELTKATRKAVEPFVCSALPHHNFPASVALSRSASTVGRVVVPVPQRGPTSFGQVLHVVTVIAARREQQRGQ